VNHQPPFYLFKPTWLFCLAFNVIRTPTSVRSLAALATGLGRETTVLRKTALFTRNAGPTLAGDFSLSFRVHRSEASFGYPGWACWLTLSHAELPLLALCWRLHI